ncbi:M16 family metallopeptidase [Limnochorda pilosa]|uniref:Peptidase M16 n=1 Tax=Limnochorda pilosa TaxID=1555112 RepID=A0A0K2SIG5_LIMPI|nr:pitrilysin family protein [Limnochorda pilosa]BAS26629.1 peptidase M16 [Limnochorda pilosa]
MHARRAALARLLASLWLLLLLAPALSQAVQGAGEGEAAVHVAQDRLANGLEIYVYEDPSAPVVSVNLWYRVGSRDEPAGRRGMAHLMEHMMFKGSERVAAEEHARIIDQVGGDANAFTTSDATVYWDKVPAAELELVLELEAERMAHLVLTEEHLRTEREVVKEEYRLGLQNDPVGQAFERFQAIALAGTVYAWTPHGFLEELDAITVQDLERFYRTYYVPSNAVLVVAGATDLPTVKRLAERHFGPLPAGEVPERAPVTATPPGEVRRERMTFPIQLPVILGGYLIPGLRSPEMEALQAAGLILSGGESARVHRSLVREQQVAVAAVATSQPYQDAGLFLAAALYLPGQEAERVAAALTQEVERLAEGVSERELQQAKNQMAADYAFSLDTLDGVANAIGAAVVLEGGLEKFTRGLEPYFALTPEDVVRVARTYLTPERLTLVEVAPGS